MEIAIAIIWLFSCQVVVADLLAGVKRKRVECEPHMVEFNQIAKRACDCPRALHNRKIKTLEAELIDAVKKGDFSPLIQHTSVFGINSEVVTNMLDTLVDLDDGETVFNIANT